MVKRSSEQQKYRDKLAHDLKELRNYGDTGRNLAKALLDKEQVTGKYFRVLGEGRKLSKEKSKELAEKLMKDGERGSIRLLIENLEKFEGLEGSDYEEIAEKAMKKGMWGILADNLGKFKGLDHKEIVKKLMADSETKEHWKWQILVSSLEKFTGLDDNDRKDIAEEFLRFCEHQVIENPRINSPIVSNYEHRGWKVLAENIDKFKGLGLDYKAITEKLMKKGYGEDVVYYIDKFKGLGLNCKWIAGKMMKYGYSGYLVRKLDKSELYEGLNRKKLAEKAMEDGKWAALAYNFEKFKGLGLDQEVVEGLINEIEEEAERSKNEIKKYHGFAEDRRTLWWDALAENLEKFEGINQQKIVERIMNDDISQVAANLKYFRGPLDKGIAEKLIGEGWGEDVAKNLDKFEGLDKEMAKTLIEEGYGKYVVDHQENFDWLDGELGKIFIECGHRDYIVKHPEKFGFKKEK